MYHKVSLNIWGRKIRNFEDSQHTGAEIPFLRNCPIWVFKAPKPTCQPPILRFVNLQCPWAILICGMWINILKMCRSLEKVNCTKDPLCTKYPLNTVPDCASRDWRHIARTGCMTQNTWPFRPLWSCEMRTRLAHATFCVLAVHNDEQCYSTVPSLFPSPFLA